MENIATLIFVCDLFWVSEVFLYAFPSLIPLRPCLFQREGSVKCFSSSKKSFKAEVSFLSDKHG